MNSIPSVPVGTTTLAGFTATLTGLAMVVISLLQGSATQDTIGAVIGGTLAVGSAVVTLAGRYAQAHALAKKATPGAAAAPASPSASQAVQAAVAETVQKAAPKRSHRAKPKAPAANHPNVPTG